MPRRTAGIEAAKNKQDLKAILEDDSDDLTDLSDLETHSENTSGRVAQLSDIDETYDSAGEDPQDDEYVAPGYDLNKDGKQEGEVQKKKRKGKTVEWSLECPFDHLGDERFRAISKDSYARSDWLLRHYHKSEVLYYAIHLGILDAATLDGLVDGHRAIFSRYFAQMVCRAYNGRTPYWLPKSVVLEGI
ncbi:Hypothetical predicted protein [Olea europaea subsp. europaea]|uniref:Uncharacterized protein n=1 Tax=Olea europaea subsp. europaea TaxID=158383 RepID=A0A8S0RBK0_OLEEU|nr:Hypothetical predicted protein [Olea europaea subsp. europaea]